MRLQGRALSLGIPVVMTAMLTSPAPAGPVGGAFVTTQAWNDAATAALGQQASVYRLYLAFSTPGETMIGVNSVDLGAASGAFYQDALGADLPPNLAFEPLAPGLRWDTYLTVNTLAQPAEAFTLGTISFGQRSLVANDGWQTWYALGEGVAGAPGATDVNGEVFVPASFDASFVYALAGQFTVLEYAADLTRPVVFDGGYIDGAGLFGGSLDLQYSTAPTNGSTIEVNGVQIVPAPGALAAAFAVGLAGARRRRRAAAAVIPEEQP